jgi:hypothetical protein
MSNTSNPAQGATGKKADGRYSAIQRPEERAMR